MLASDQEIRTHSWKKTPQKRLQMTDKALIATASLAGQHCVFLEGQDELYKQQDVQVVWETWVTGFIQDTVRPGGKQQSKG